MRFGKIWQFFVNFFCNFSWFTYTAASYVEPSCSSPCLPEQPHREGRVPLSGGDPVAALQLLGGHVRPAVEVERHLQGEALLRLEAELVADRTRTPTRAELMLGHRVLEGVVKEFSYVKTPLKRFSNLWIIFGKL